MSEHIHVKKLSFQFCKYLLHEQRQKKNELPPGFPGQERQSWCAAEMPAPARGIRGNTSNNITESRFIYSKECHNKWENMKMRDSYFRGKNIKTLMTKKPHPTVKYVNRFAR